MNSGRALGVVQSVGFYASLVGLGWGLGVIWTAATTMRAAPSPPPSWAAALTPAYNSLALYGALVLVLGTVVAFGTDYIEQTTTLGDE